MQTPKIIKVDYFYNAVGVYLVYQYYSLPVEEFHHTEH